MAFCGRPLSSFARRALELASGLPVRFVVGTASEIEDAFRGLYDADEEIANAPEGGLTGDAGHEEDLQRLKDMAAEAPVIRYVNQLLQEAVAKRASDIHLEPFHGLLRVRLCACAALL